MISMMMMMMMKKKRAPLYVDQDDDGLMLLMIRMVRMMYDAVVALANVGGRNSPLPSCSRYDAIHQNLVC
jgi:hypothetical protein